MERVSAGLKSAQGMIPKAMVSKETMLIAGVGVGAVVAAPILLSAAGFGAAGVTAGSIAAAIQGPAVVANSWFALAQSAGAVGFGLGTKVGIFATASGTTKLVASAVTKLKGK